MIGAAALAIALATSPPAEGARLRPWTRGATPALAGPDLAGGRVDLRDLRGRVALVSFWASWCEPCEEELPALARLRDALRGRPFALLTVSFGEGPERVTEFLRARGLELPVLLDRSRHAAEAWGVGGLPMTFLVDAGGRVRWWVFGACDGSAGEPRAALDALLGEAERAAAGPRARAP